MARDGNPTRKRLLDAAERLFGAHGFDATSLRAIAVKAGVQQPLIHYHFATKLGLYRAIWERRYAAAWMGQDQLSDLDFNSDRESILRSLVTSLLAPPLRLAQSAQGRAFLQILSRELVDPRASARGLIALYIEPIDEQVMAALAKALPNMAPDRLEDVRSLVFTLVTSTAGGLDARTGSVKAAPASTDLLIEFAIGGLMRIERLVG